MNSTTASSCCICLNEYDAQESPFELSCGHRLHSSCMLRFCLSRAEEPRCPYCRAPVRLGRQGDDEDDFPTEDESAEESSAASLGELPQWQQLSWGRHPPRGHALRVRREVVRRMLQRARNKHAPAVLKRCADEHRRLAGALLSAKKDEAKYKGGRAGKTVKETLARLRDKRSATLRAEQRLGAHLKRVLNRCQGSHAVVEYLRAHPLAEVA